ILTVLTHKQESLVRAILLTGIPASGASLTGKVGIHFDRHTVVQGGFVSDIAVQFGKSPRRSMTVRPSLRAARLFAPFALCPLAKVCQIFQANKRLGMRVHNAPTDRMVDSLFQPSLP